MTRAFHIFSTLENAYTFAADKYMTTRKIIENAYTFAAEVDPPRRIDPRTAEKEQHLRWVQFVEQRMSEDVSTLWPLDTNRNHLMVAYPPEPHELWSSTA